MTQVFAMALGLPEGYFDSYTDHSIDTVRVNKYRMPDTAAVLERGQLGMGAHTDFGIVTLLWADPLPGLEILTPEGHWRSVIPAAGALLVNLGDVLARWTNDQWRSTMHRVKAPIDGAGRPFRRRSAAYFHDGNADAVIATLPGCERRDVEP
jgi:isopenicillin N synthase-like dioxygenase